jgi:hypothetical protein
MGIAKKHWLKLPMFFGNTSKDAIFIWSSNLELDNLVLLIKKIG